MCFICFIKSIQDWCGNGRRTASENPLFHKSDGRTGLFVKINVFGTLEIDQIITVQGAFVQEEQLTLYKNSKFGGPRRGAQSVQHLTLDFGSRHDLTVPRDRASSQALC